MALTTDDVQHIASLARLELTADETTRLQGELSKILDYIGELQKVDTAGVEPTAQVTGLVNRFDEDTAVPVDPETRQRLLDAFPARDGDYLKVRAIFE